MKMFYDVPMGNGTLEELADKERVRELVEYERYCRDYFLFDAERALWWDDGTVWTTWCKSSIDEFVNKSRAKVSGLPGGHKAHNTIVWLNGNKAVAEYICALAFRCVLEGELVDMEIESRLHFRAEKRDGKWGLLYFEGIYEKDRMIPAFSDSTYTIPREKLQEFRPCNRHQTYRLKVDQPAQFATGLANADTWCGWDKPETVQRLYNETSEWFFS